MADEEQRTPLHWAAGMGHADVAALLLKEGAKLEAADSKGNTPLHYAGERRAAAVRHAAARDAHVAFRRSRLALSWTYGTLVLAFARGLLRVTLRLSRTIRATSLLCPTAGYGRPALVRMLMDAGASCAARNANGKSPADLT